MRIFEALDVRKRIETECDIVVKLGQQYMRHTPEGPQCAACGMFVVGPEPRRASCQMHAHTRKNFNAPGWAGT
jgi:hypothetical protein